MPLLSLEDWYLICCKNERYVLNYKGFKDSVEQYYEENNEKKLKEKETKILPVSDIDLTSLLDGVD